MFRYNCSSPKKDIGNSSYQTKNQIMKHKRPKNVTWLTVGVLSFVAINITRCATAVTQWDFLSSLPLSGSPLYLAATGLIWAIIGLPIIWGLWVGKGWTPRVIKVYVVLYAIYYWLERWLIKSNPIMNTCWATAAIITTILIILVFWITLHPSARKFFGEYNERKPKN